MPRIRVPAHHQDKAREIDAKKWVKSKKFPRQKWFEIVHGCKEQLTRANGTTEADNKSLAIMVGAALDEEGFLLEHVLELAVTIENDAKWFEMCVAAAWVILQEFYNAVENGEWG